MAFSLLNKKNCVRKHFFNMHTTTVNSKRISNDEDKMIFPLAAVTGTSGRSTVAFTAVSAAQYQSYQVSGRMQREGGRRVGDACVCGLQFLKKTVAGNFSFHLQAVVHVLSCGRAFQPVIYSTHSRLPRCGCWRCS